MMNKVWWNTFATIDLKYATITVRDGSSTPNSIEVKIGEGNLTYSEKVERIYELDRGKLDTVRDGDEQPVDVSFDFQWEYITTLSSATVPTLEDALKRVGAASGWVSTDTDACAPYAVDIQIEYVPNCQPTGNSETITLADFRYEELNHDLRNASIACTGKCNVTEATAVRS